MCVQLLCVLLIPFGRGIESLCFNCRTSGSEVGVSLSRVTFEPCRVLLWAWHVVLGEPMAVNGAEHTGIVWKVRREEKLRRCEVGVTVVRWCCHTQTGNEVSSCVGRVVERLRSLCVYFSPVDAVRF